MIRLHAGNSTELLRDLIGQYISNLQVDTYKPGENINRNQNAARQALRRERRLECAMENALL
ncbi:hypothetical protein GCM10027443_04550 [Pontibacter brevis]